MPIRRSRAAAESARRCSAAGGSTAVLTLQTDPLSVAAGVDRSLAGVGADHADVLGPVALYNGRSRNSKVAEPFQIPLHLHFRLGTFGSSGRNIIHGPGIENFDASLFQDHSGFGAEAVRAALGVIQLSQSPEPSTEHLSQSAAFGRLTSARDPRIMQIAAKFYF